MRYLKSFNERLGVNLDIDAQVDEYFRQINSSDKKDFQFIYKNEKGEFPFTLYIGSLNRSSGNFAMDITTGEMSIYLRSRTDHSTLLHEVKHLDFATRKPDYHKELLYLANKSLSGVGSLDPLSKITHIFYIFNDNEFQSKYHGYYKEFDNWISSRVSSNPTPKEIWGLFAEFLTSVKDRTWSWYFMDGEFRFSDYLSDAQINRLFTQFIYNKDIYRGELDNPVKYFTIGLKKSFKTKFNKYTQDELKEIEKLKKFYEKRINHRLPRYRRKFSRLIQLMIDKWC